MNCYLITSDDLDTLNLRKEIHIIKPFRIRRGIHKNKFLVPVEAVAFDANDWISFPIEDLDISTLISKTDETKSEFQEIKTILQAAGVKWTPLIRVYRRLFNLGLENEINLLTEALPLTAAQEVTRTEILNILNQ